MAEILVKALVPPSSDEGEHYQLGDIIVVRPDGWGWGTQEGLPNFWLIKIPGLPVEVVHQYESAHTDFSLLVDPEGVPFPPRILKRRKFKVDTVKIPKQIRDQLTSTGTITINATTANKAILNKVSGTYEG